jgi:hypothetical protein
MCVLDFLMPSQDQELRHRKWPEQPDMSWDVLSQALEEGLNERNGPAWPQFNMD